MNQHTFSINTIYYWIVFKIEYVGNGTPIRVPHKVVKAPMHNKLLYDKTYKELIEAEYNAIPGRPIEVILVAQPPILPLVEGQL